MTKTRLADPQDDGLESCCEPACWGSVSPILLNLTIPATRLNCSFPLITTGTWTNGEPEAELGTSTLKFQFVEIDPDGATANAVGPFGPSHIITRLSGDYLHFMQLFNIGPLYTTTVINRETHDGKFMAVHTRHEYTDVRLTGFTSRPEQYYGECEVQ